MSLYVAFMTYVILSTIPCVNHFVIKLVMTEDLAALQSVRSVDLKAKSKNC